ncbi:MAG: energy transducer TonB [Sphingobium sp.]
MKQPDCLHARQSSAGDHDSLFDSYVVMTSYYPETKRRWEQEAPSPATVEIMPAASPGHGRYSDRPMDWRTRLFGMSGTLGVFAVVAACALFTWHTVYAVPPVSEPLVVTLQPLAALPEPVEEVPEGPRQIKQKEQKPKEAEERPEPPEIVIPRPATLTLPAVQPVEEVKAADPVPETTAPRSMPAPPARQAASDQKATWEAQLLAHLEKYRRYPATARARREEGIAYVTFRMNRAGSILSAEVVRSSGSALLDRAALDTLKRAQPLPKIPDDKPNTLELSVPVEFFVTR